MFSFPFFSIHPLHQNPTTQPKHPHTAHYREALLHLIASHDSDTTEGSDSADAVAEWSRRHTPHGPPSVAPHSTPSHAHRPTHSPSTGDDDTSLASPTVTGGGPGTSRTSSFRQAKGGGTPSTPVRAERARAESTSTSSRSLDSSRRPSSSCDSDVFAPSGGGAGGAERRRRKESGGRGRRGSEPEARSEAVPEEPSDDDDYGDDVVPEEPSCAETSDVAEEPSTASSRHSHHHHQHPAAGSAGWQQQQQRQRRRHVDVSLPLASPRTPLGGTPLFKEAARGSPSDAVFAASVRGYHGGGHASGSREREPVTPQPQWSAAAAAGKRSMGWSAMETQRTRDPLLPIGGSGGGGKGFWY